jgi:hypothetical protein
MRLLALLVLSAVAALASCHGTTPVASLEPTVERPRLFLAGDGELWVVDVVNERARRLRMSQLVPGDPPVKILRRGDGLALWGYHVWRLDARTPERPPRRIVRRGWIFIASAHAQRIWVGLLDPRSPATVRALRAVREVTIDGRVTVSDRRPPRGRWPQLAVRDGLLFGNPHGGWDLWNPAARRVVRRWDENVLGFLGAAHGDLIASSPEPWTSVRFTDARTGVQRRVSAPPGWELLVTSGAFSPDGRIWAAPAQRRAGDDGPARLALVDIARRRIRLVPGSTVSPGYTFARWSRAGTHVFLTGGERLRDRTIVAHRIGQPRARRLRVRVGDFYDAAAY